MFELQVRTSWSEVITSVLIVRSAKLFQINTFWHDWHVRSGTVSARPHERNILSRPSSYYGPTLLWMDLSAYNVGCDKQVCTAQLWRLRTSHVLNSRSFSSLHHFSSVHIPVCMQVLYHVVSGQACPRYTSSTAKSFRMHKYFSIDGCGLVFTCATRGSPIWPNDAINWTVKLFRFHTFK
jgi:hypothetical protein